MRRQVRIRAVAQADIEEAAQYYELQSSGLGQRFLDEVLSSLQSFESNPFRYPAVHDEIRRALVHRFPFGVFYLVEPEEVVVIAVMHGTRDPSRWKKRI
ncbi:MAG: type II toxin-antitoxin system RelE/ParE family toxin [Armatimonadetes bacterium]|nr:type II toxin-antitoxin system RelE/ParE family toxin [Armatimonadota bacterium]